MTGLLAAIISARTTGVGCDVDTSLFEVALHQLGYAGTWYLNEGQVCSRLPRSSHFSVSPVQTFPASDGWVYVMCMTERFWQALIDQIGRQDLGKDPRFGSAQDRFAHKEALTQELDATFRTASVSEWIERLGKHLPIGPVNDVAGALDNSFVDEIGMITDVPHPERGDFRMIANPIRIDGRRMHQAPCSALGADNAALLD